MPLQICKVFYIFVLYFKVVLRNVVNYLVSNYFLWVHTLTRCIHRNIYTWFQYEKAISTWLQHIRTKIIQAPGCHPFLTLHHPPTLEASTSPTKLNCSYKTFTQLDYLPLELLHNIDMQHEDIVHCKKLKPVTQHHPVLCVSTSYKLKYAPFDYYMHCDHIEYVWEDRRLGIHSSVHKWEKQLIKHELV